ncbi:MAG TPA: TIGR01777 family oxidoreductase [Rugosimonospora sp.]|nr:TIGR01777 family oxidoreductase [Rugosimonospora sp.]
MRIIVAGSSGYIGTALVRRLREAGHELLRLVRREPDRPDEVHWRPDRQDLDPNVVDGAQAVINLTGAGIGDRRWTGEYRKLLRSSRVNPTQALAKAITLATDPPRVLLNASAVGYYGDAGDTELDESAPPGTDFLGGLCQDWEAATQPAEEAGIRVVHLRTGLVLGPGGLLKPLLRLYRVGLGGRLGSGRQWMPWISLADEVGAIEFLLDAERVSGAANLTGPAPVRNSEFTRTLGELLRRPAVLPVPAVALRVAIGEFGPESLASQRAVPAALTAAGYPFRHDTLTAALSWVLAGSA